MVTNYFLDLISKNIFGVNGAESLPSTYYIGLSTTEPTVAGTGVSEPSSANGYIRKAISSFQQNKSTAGSVSNASEISFPEATGNWGSVPYYCIFDASESGNLLIYGSYTNTKTIEAGSTAKIPVGGITLGISNQV